MEFNLDNIRIYISSENNGVRLKTEEENWFIPNQTLDETRTILDKNFKIIKEHFSHKSGNKIPKSDLEIVSLKIALNFFQLYNHWRTMYKREATRDLTFIPKDFTSFETINIIIGYFKNKYPTQYESKCEVMLEMTNSQLKHAVIRRDQYENK